MKFKPYYVAIATSFTPVDPSNKWLMWLLLMKRIIRTGLTLILAFSLNNSNQGIYYERL